MSNPTTQHRVLTAFIERNPPVSIFGVICATLIKKFLPFNDSAWLGIMQLGRRFLAGREAATTATDTAGSLAAQWANPDAILRGRAGDIVAPLEWTSSWCVTKPS